MKDIFAVYSKGKYLVALSEFTATAMVAELVRLTPEGTQTADYPVIVELVDALAEANS